MSRSPPALAASLSPSPSLLEAYNPEACVESETTMVNAWAKLRKERKPHQSSSFARLALPPASAACSSSSNRRHRSPPMRRACSSLGSLVSGLLQRSMVLARGLEALPHHVSHLFVARGRDAALFAARG